MNTSKFRKYLDLARINRYMVDSKFIVHTIAFEPSSILYQKFKGKISADDHKNKDPQIRLITSHN